MKGIKFFVLVLSLCASSNLLAVVFPSYVSQTLSNLGKAGKTVIMPGVTIAAQYLDKKELNRLFGSRADLFDKKYDVIQCTVENNSPNNYMVNANNITGLRLIAKDIVAHDLDTFTWQRVQNTKDLMYATIVTSHIAFFGLFGPKSVIAKTAGITLSPILGPMMSMFSFQDPTFIPQLEDQLKLGSTGVKAAIAAYMIIPATTAIIAAISLFKSYRASKHIGHDLAEKMLSPHSTKVVIHNSSLNFLLFISYNQRKLYKFQINGVEIPIFDEQHMGERKRL